MKAIVSLLAGALALALSADVAASDFLADRHVEKYEVPCESCHDPKAPGVMKQKDDQDVCTDCHGDYGKLVKLTQPKDEAEGNPHAQHDGILPCTECHKGHKAGVNYCAECHTWEFKTP